MKYQNQFTIEKDSMYYNNPRAIESIRKDSAASLGNRICNKIGFKETDGDMQKKFEIELMAFPYDEWVKFKKTLKDFLDGTTMSTASIGHVGELFNKLDEGFFATEKIKDNAQSEQ